MFRNPVTDLIIVLVIALLVFGPKRLPQLGRGLGHGFREFKDGITGKSTPDDSEERPALTSATSSPSEPASATSSPSEPASVAEPSSSEGGPPERSA